MEAVTYRRHRSKRQSGFGIVELVVVIAAVGVIGAAGWLILQHDLNKATGTTGSNQTSNQATPMSQSINTFTIPELNAKMTLPDGLTPTDLKYSISTLDGNPAAGFTTTILEQADGTGSCSASQASIGVIWRTTQNVASGSVTVKQIGQYYYAFQKPQGSCTGNLTAGKLEQSQTTLLKQAFETLTATN